MNGDSFIRLLAKNADFTLQDTVAFMDAFVKSVEECVRNRDGFTIVNVGVLDFTKVKARTVVGNKLFNGETKNFPESEKMFFRLSQNLKRLLKKTKKQEVIEQVSEILV